MKSWRAPLACALLIANTLGAFCAGLYIKTPVVQVVIFLFCVDVGLLALCFAQDDGRERGEK